MLNSKKVVMTGTDSYQCALFDRVFSNIFSHSRSYGIKVKEDFVEYVFLPSFFTAVWVASPIFWLHLSGAIDPCVEPAKSQCMAHRYHPTRGGDSLSDSEPPWGKSLRFGGLDDDGNHHGRKL